jgi:hypothetical protein
VLDGGRLEDDDPELDGVPGLELLDDPGGGVRAGVPDDLDGTPTGGLGTALPTADPL